MAKERVVTAKRVYDTKAIIREREYGFFWYSWFWTAARPALILLISLLLAIGILVSAGTYIYDHTLKPMDVNDPSTVTVEIPSGSSVSKIADILANQNLLRSTGVFRYMVMFQGVTNKIHYGKYQIAPSMTVNEIIGVLTSGAGNTERTITIIPGWTIDDIAAYLKKQGAVGDVNEFLRLCNDANLFASYYTIENAMSDGSMAGRKYALEGYLAPDTYRVFTDATAEQIIRRLMDQTEVVLNDVYSIAGQDDEEAPARFATNLTYDQSIILASMIEKEAVKDEDFARVSAVFHNRLTSGVRLESDPTIKYTTGVKRFILTEDELRANTLYNTYVITGLPVGPICSPSKRALEAALYPDMEYIKDKYMFFCSMDPNTGDLYFSKTKTEHDAAVRQYRPLWEEYDRKQMGS